MTLGIEEGPPQSTSGTPLFSNHPGHAYVRGSIVVLFGLAILLIDLSNVGNVVAGLIITAAGIFIIRYLPSWFDFYEDHFRLTRKGSAYDVPYSKVTKRKDFTTKHGRGTEFWFEINEGGKSRRIKYSMTYSKNLSEFLDKRLPAWASP